MGNSFVLPYQFMAGPQNLNQCVSCIGWVTNVCNTVLATNLTKHFVKLSDWNKTFWYCLSLFFLLSDFDFISIGGCWCRENLRCPTTLMASRRVQTSLMLRFIYSFTHWAMGESVDILQKTFSSAFSSTEVPAFWFKVHWDFILKPSHYLSQLWHSSLTHT